MRSGVSLKFLFLLCLAGWVIPVCGQIPLYKDPSAPVAERVNDLLRCMTLTEKLAQLTEMSVDVLKQENNIWKNALNYEKLKNGIGCLDGFTLSGGEYARRINEVQTFLMNESRLGIPALPVSEALHGWVQDGATIFPQSIGMGATFNPSLIHQVGVAIRNEMMPAGVKQALFPNLDLARDPRWGRVEETFGEDPCLVSVIGNAMIRGFQEGDGQGTGLVCTGKHFYGHNSPQSGLNIASTSGGNYDLFNVHLKSFKSAVEKAGLLSLMSSYVTYDGIPTNANRRILTDVLRSQWGFKGFVYSDWGAVEFLKYIHHFASTEAEAARYAIEAGVDLEAPAPRCFKHLDSLVAHGVVSLSTIDSAVSRVLYVKFKIGLFEHPYPKPEELKQSLHTAGNIALSRKVADESLVLLKNKNGLLPLDRSRLRSIAVIGPNADQVQFGDYSWTRNNKDGVTLLAGLTKQLGAGVSIHYAKGCELTSPDTSGFREALEAAQKSDLVILAIGTASGALSRDLQNATCGEGFDVDDLRPTGAQYELAKRLINSGKKVITVLITGRTLDVSWIDKYGDAVLCAWYPGEKGGDAVAAALLGDINPSGKLPVSFPRSTGQLPVFYNYLPANRGYYHKPGSYDRPGRDYVFDSARALYPFGFGLSYTHFSLKDFRVNQKLLPENDTLEASFTITNTGRVDGAEVVQLYIRRDYAPVMTPVKELKSFEKVFLKKGQTKEITLKVPVADLAFYDNDGRPVSLRGSYRVMIGNSSEHILYEAGFKVQEETTRLPDTLAPLPAGRKADNIALSLKQEAAVDFNLRRLPATVTGWESYKADLRRLIWQAAGVRVDHNLPLDYHETGVIKKQGYTIRKIYFQTRPGVYATANLYVPEGKGLFPAVINMHGHWAGGKAGDMVQSCAHELALNGYVCLNIDAWGSGERTTVHGVHEYHGSNLGASLLDLGETLLGAQLADNIRGVDLLCSLPYVNRNRIGATGASGGGNQTMWLSAMDDRIQACMPVVSVGSFQSYVMGSNCVCELLPRGLTFTEESGVLALIAPRALKIVNGLQDRNKAFSPSEMLRSFANARGIYDLYNHPENISYKLFDTPHGYWPVMREQLLGWFDLHLKGKGDGSPVKELPFNLLTDSELMVFPKGKRSPSVQGTAEYSRTQGKRLADEWQKAGTLNKEGKLKALRAIISLPADTIRTVQVYTSDGQRSQIMLETVRGQLIPATLLPAKAKGMPAVIILFTDKEEPNFRDAVINEYSRKGYTIAVADLWGLGTSASAEAKATDGSLPPFHTLARAALWLGHSVQGEWALEIKLLTDYIRKRFAPASLRVDASRETAVAALIQSALYSNTDTCVLRTCPVSYGVDNRDGIDFFNMSLHLPGILPWGDISLLTALSRSTLVEFSEPVSISGKPVTGGSFREFETKVEKYKTELL